MTKSQGILCTLLVILIGLLSVSHAMLTVESGSLNGTTIRTGQFYKKGDDFTSFFTPISGYLTLENATDAQVNGRIVLVPRVPQQVIYSHFFALQARGAIGIIYITRALVPGQYFCTYTGEDVTQLVIPVAEIYQKEVDSVFALVAQGEEIFVSLSSEGNEWANIIVNNIATLIVFRIILGAVSVGLIGFALSKLILFVKNQGPQFNVPQVCLGLEIISNMWRVIWVTGDPFGCFFNYGTAITSFLDTISLPYATATFVLITFYWYEAVSDTSIKIYPFLSKLQIPFFVIMLVLIAVDLVVSLLGYFNGIDTGALTVIYIIISTGFVIFYFITVGKISKRLQTSQATGRRYKHLSKVNQKMILNGITKFLLVIVAIAFAFDTVNSMPIPQYVTTIFIIVAIDVDSWARIFLFDVRKKSSTSKGSNSDKNNTSSGRTASTTNLGATDDLRASSSLQVENQV
eukprot:TRINITY_DN5743_c0_g1_i1.p1 TRINITY_DN5743_c0_g1~~TRINITY_DN5743_c0_g1_i1.p1  ORF type:complete len:471 (+),score=57.30 TRINITY_DN5743_c0_g1_i1:36-1415(+)